MKVPATAAVVGLAMWVGLAVAAPAADVLVKAATAMEQKVIAAHADGSGARGSAGRGVRPWRA